MWKLTEVMNLEKVETDRKSVEANRKMWKQTEIMNLDKVKTNKKNVETKRKSDGYKWKPTENVLLKNVETSRNCVLQIRKRTENCMSMDSDGFHIIFVKEGKPTEFDFLPDSYSC